jgi:hypothetical protein
MPNKFYSVILYLSDGHSSLPVAYAVSIGADNNLTNEELEDLILKKIASHCEFSFNGEYYETVGYCGIQMNRIEEITEGNFNAVTAVFPNFVCHIDIEVNNA